VVIVVQAARLYIRRLEDTTGGPPVPRHEKDHNMKDSRIATVRPVAEAEATKRVAEIFADIKATKNIDFIPNFWRVLAVNPTQLELVWTQLKTLMHPEAAGRSSPRRDPQAARPTTAHK